MATTLPFVRTRSADADTQVPVELTTTMYGGSFEQAWRKAVFEPFAALHPEIRIRTVTGLSTEIAAMARAQRNDVKIDVLTMDEPLATEVAEEGLYHPLDVAAVPALGELYPRFRLKGDPYATMYYYALVLTYDKLAIKEEPQSWVDLWKPQYKNLVAIPDITTSQGSMFLLVLAHINGGSAANIDPAFAALKRLKPSLVTFWTQHAQVAQLFTQGEIVMAPWVPDRTDALIDAGGHVAWTIPRDKTCLSVSTIGIAKGSKHIEAARKYIDFVLSAHAQEGIAKYGFNCPVNSKVELQPDIAAKLPVGSEALSKMLPIDWSLVARERPKWVERWNREIAGP